MKKILITATVLFLTACSSAPNIVGTNKPILNMAANLAPALDVDLSDNTAALKNKTTQQLNVLYHLYWYNTQGVTQVWPNQQESQSAIFYCNHKKRKCLSYQNQAQKVAIIVFTYNSLCPHY